MERGRGGGLSRWKTTGAFDGERAIVEHYYIKENCIYVNLIPRKKKEGGCCCNSHQRSDRWL
jgi:hypothetical protein